MMSPNNPQPIQDTNNNNNKNSQTSSSQRKTSSSTTTRQQDQQQQQQQQQALTCPRCDSPNTKFCYYNNYSLTQPRHFCKTCRRYWTKGGALRNVPIGGGCRKTKKIKSSSRLSSCDSKDSGSSSELGGFKFFHGLSPVMDFNLGGLSFPSPRLNPSPTTANIYNNQFTSFAHTSATSPSCFSLDPSASCSSLMGFNFPIPSGAASQFSGAIQDLGSGSMNVSTSLASSIENLSNINQDLHWKLQQQRLAMLFGGDGPHQKDHGTFSVESQVHKPQPILFQNLEISKQEVCGGASAGGGTNNSRREGGGGGASGGTAAVTEWFLGNSHGQMSSTTPVSRNGNGNGNSGNWNGVHQSWSDLHQYNALP